jgi:hypothetical protein
LFNHSNYTGISGKKRLPSFLKSLYFLIALIIGLASCSKKTDNWNIPDEFQSWCRYREGSYWIYRNEKTQQIDCTYVTQYTSGTYPHYGDEDKITYYFDLEESDITGSFLSKIYTESASKNFAVMSVSGKYLSGILNFSTDLLANPKYYKASYHGTSSGVVAVYPKQEVNGNSFGNVYHYRTESQTWDGDSVITDGHLVKNIGLILYKKRIDQVDTTWTLVRWHVKQ